MYRVRVATLDTFPAKIDSMDSLFVVDSVGYFLAKLLLLYLTWSL